MSSKQVWRQRIAPVHYSWALTGNLSVAGIMAFIKQTYWRAICHNFRTPGVLLLFGSLERECFVCSYLMLLTPLLQRLMKHFIKTDGSFVIANRQQKHTSPSLLLSLVHMCTCIIIYIKPGFQESLVIYFASVLSLCGTFLTVIISSLWSWTSHSLFQLGFLFLHSRDGYAWSVWE